MLNGLPLSSEKPPPQCDRIGGGSMSLQRKPPIPNTVRELMRAKTTAQDAISELLELLPQNDVRCGMVRVLVKSGN